MKESFVVSVCVFASSYLKMLWVWLMGYYQSVDDRRPRRARAVQPIWSAGILLRCRLHQQLWSRGRDSIWAASYRYVRLAVPMDFGWKTVDCGCNLRRGKKEIRKWEQEITQNRKTKTSRTNHASELMSPLFPAVSNATITKTNEYLIWPRPELKQHKESMRKKNSQKTKEP